MMRKCGDLGVVGRIRRASHVMSRVRSRTQPCEAALPGGAGEEDPRALARGANPGAKLQNVGSS